MGRNELLTPLKGVRDLLHPILWLEEGADIDDENADKIKKMVVTPLVALEAVQWLLVALGGLGMLIAIGYFLARCCKKDQYV